MEARSPRSRCQQGCAPSRSSGGGPFLVSPSFWGLPALLGVGAAWLQSLPPSSSGPSVSGSPISLCLTLIRTTVIEFKAHPDNPRGSHDFKLMTSTKTPFPNKVTFTGTRGLELGGTLFNPLQEGGRLACSVTLFLQW